MQLCVCHNLTVKITIMIVGKIYLRLGICILKKVKQFYRFVAGVILHHVIVYFFKFLNSYENLQTVYSSFCKTRSAKSEICTYI